MEKNFDLPAASHEQLLALIAEQQAVIQELQRRIAALEEQLRPGGRGGAMPGTKPPTTRRKERKEQRKLRPYGFARRRMTPTETVDHVVEHCSDCGTRLQGGWVQRTREVLEVPVTPLRVVEQRFLARDCPMGRKRWVAPCALGDLVVGKQRLGVGLVSLIATLRETARLPIHTIQRLLATIYQLRLSVGGITAALHGVAHRGVETLAAVRESGRASPVVHADETGWREEGVNGYVWTCSTPTERYFVRRGRGKGVVDEVLGEDFCGVLVSDFYAAYNHYPGLHQRCWAHLLRDIHNLRQLYPKDVGLTQWAMAVRAIYDDACLISHPDARVRGQEQHRLEEQLLALCRPFVDDPLAVQRKLCRRVERFLTELFVFVGEPLVPPDNNAAERSLRHLVTQRKISGGTRSPRGSATKMALASLFGTWQAQGLNPFLACRQLLVSPQE